MSLRMASGGPEGIRFPRVSGDEPKWLSEEDAAFVFSPRERG